MINKPLVSIVIPTYNQRETFLRECIESAIAQTYTNVEIVISDNYSTNNASTVIDEYAVKDKRIRVVKPESFLNLSESFLYVFTQATGEYCCYVSSDDVLMPTCVESLVKTMEENNDVVFSHGKAIYFQKDNTSEVKWEYFNANNGIYDLNKEVAERLLNFAYICFGGCLIRTSVWSEISSQLSSQNLIIECSLDILLVALLFERGKVYYYNEVLVKVRMENDLRNSLQTYLIKDAAFVWNYWEDNEVISSKIEYNSIDFCYYKRKHFKNLYRAAFYEYFNGLLTSEGFKSAIENLKLFNLTPPLLFHIFYKIILGFPILSIKFYRIIKK